MKHFLSFAIVFAMLTYSVGGAYAATNEKISDWARVEVKRASSLELLTNGLGTDYTKPITRLQFAALVVNFVEVATGKDMSVGNISFKDSDDTVAKKAAASHIVKGTGDGTTFSPDRLITREEIATMIYRSIQYIDKKLLKAPEDLNLFSDAQSISDWANDAMRSMVATGIMKGVSDTQISPKENSSIEQGVILIYRCYQKVVVAKVDPLIHQFINDQKVEQYKLQQEYAGEGKSATTFTDSRINSLKMVEVYHDVLNQPRTYVLFLLNFSLKAEHPDSISLIGGVDMDADGWVSLGLPTVLVFMRSDTEFDFVGGFITEFTPDGNAQIFRSDFEEFLKANAQ